VVQVEKVLVLVRQAQQILVAVVAGAAITAQQAAQADLVL
jgi:hypothetical protein